ncbi:hypothetical protein BU15DRAFT_55939 [Melanogaster broomeanus]|nr:hypothetical protein BU15DRAFT_55939 [Melanogaster broomeanus]
MSTSSQRILSLYRSYLREVRRLPHVYLRQFFRIQGGDDFRSAMQTRSDELRKTKLKRISRGLRRLHAANAGDYTAFDRTLDIAYGRVGKLRWELLEPLLSDPNAPLPAMILPGKRNLDPPVYSAELAALLTSGNSHNTRPLEKRHLVFPPCLPERAKLDSEEAAMLGPLSRRREVNLRWRFFRSECKKVHPPLQISERPPAPDQDTITFSASPRSIGFQDTTVLQDQKMQQRSEETLQSNPFDGNLPVRWLRRRYQSLLARIPLLTRRPPHKDKSKPLYDVQLADNAIIPAKPHTTRLRAIDSGDMPWICDIRIPDKSRRR